MSWIGRLAVVSIAAILPVTYSFSQQPGYVRITLAKGGLIAGAGAGRGVLTYRGRDYPFRISGLSFGVTAGASVNRMEGWASGIRHVSDFAGTYSSVGAGGGLIGGVGSVSLMNEKGVRIALQGRKVGVELAANLGAVRISLK